MAAVGTRELLKDIRDRGFKLWEVKLTIPTGTTGVSKESQNLQINGLLQHIAIVAPNLVTDTQYALYILNSVPKVIARKDALADNGTQDILFFDLNYNGAKAGGAGLPIFSDDYLKVEYATAQSGGSLDFDVYLRGTQ